MSDVSLRQETTVLIVEDNKIDVRLTRHALQRLTAWPLAIEVVDDGDKAIKFLEHSASKPDLVILDINLPKRDGVEVLQFIRASARLQDLLVFVFSSSQSDLAEERMTCAGVKADRYFEKPHDSTTYLKIAEQMKAAYAEAAQLRGAAAAG